MLQCETYTDKAGDHETRRAKSVMRHPNYQVLALLIAVSTASLFVLNNLSTLKLQAASQAKASLGSGDDKFDDDGDSDDDKTLPPMKIVGFTDIGYLPIARRWYSRLLQLGYTEQDIVIACNDEASYAALQKENNTSIEQCFIPNPDRKRMIKGFWRQLMMQRLKYTVDKLRSGVSLLVTDIDNVFMRHVPLMELWKEPYDVMHAYATYYPANVKAEMGFVVCSGHQWLRATNETIRFMELVIDECRHKDKCDDQIAYNGAIHHKAHIQWDKDPTRKNVSRVVSGGYMNGLLKETLTGRSNVTNHTVKVWDRDYATRWKGDPDFCPPLSNWVAMPFGMQSVDALKKGRTESKLLQMDAWIEMCGPNGTIRKQTALIG